MLDKLINDLKSKFNAKKKGNETEDSEDESEESHDELHADHEEDQDSESDSLEAKPKTEKKKNSMVIKVVIVLAIGYLAYDYLMPKEDEVSIDQMVQNAAKPKRKKPKREEAATVANTENTATESVPNETANPNANPEEATQSAPSENPPVEQDLSSAPIENINVSSAVNSDSSSAPPATDPMESNVPTSPPEQTSPSAPSVGEAIIEDVKVSELPMSGMGEGTSAANSNRDNVDPIESAPKETSLSSKIETVSEYVPPPKYEILGRGLIYNCKGKHWACVDKENYQVCFKNMKWNTDNGKASECVTQNVYANEDDCGKVQRYNVSTNVETSFCKN